MPEQSKYCAGDIELYKEICANIRVTDDISFRLLGAVPLASTVLSGGLLLLEKTEPIGRATAVAVVLLSLLGAMITIGLFRWELRNVRWCRWLIRHAADFEHTVLAGGTQRAHSESPSGIQFDRWNEEGLTVPLPSLFHRGPWNKTEAEKLIYSGAVAVWLVPLMVAVISLARFE